MTPDAMHRQFGEYTAVEIARHVGDLRTTTTTSSPRSWHMGRLARRATPGRISAVMSGLLSGLKPGLLSGLRPRTEPGTVEPAQPHVMPMPR